MRTLRGVVVWLLPVLVLTACDTGTEPVLAEIESYEFSASVERLGDGPGLFLAHHKTDAALEPKDFSWPTDYNSYSRIGRWEPDSSPAHSVGLSMGFGVAPASGTLVVEYSVEWVNGEPEKPFTFSPLIAFTMERYFGKGSHEKVVTRFTLRQIGKNRYRVELPIPADPAEYYGINLVPGVTLQCNSEGVKSFLLRDVVFSGAGFQTSQIDGSVLFTGTCQQPPPRYSVAG